MQTLCIAQLLVLSAAMSFGVTREDFAPLWAFNIPSVVAQACLLYYAFFRFKRVLLVCYGALGASMICSVFLLFLTFVRTWRFIFFPIKEDLLFVLECVARFFLELIYFFFLVLQVSKIKIGEVKYDDQLFLSASIVLFFHDFAYAVPIAMQGEMYTWMGWTHFGVHVVMGAVCGLTDMNGGYMMLFVLLWTALLAQHVFTTIMFIDDVFVLGFNAVYFFALLLYFTNAYLWFTRE